MSTKINSILILPNLWLGSIDDVNDNFISKEKIKLIINACDGYPNYFPDDPIPLEKDFVCKMTVDPINAALNETVNQIHKGILNGDSVLIYCNKGRIRAPVIVAAYLIKFYKFNVAESVEFIKLKRQVAFSDFKCVTLILIPFYHFIHNYH